MFDNGIVKVNKTFFEVPGTQFPIKNIGSVTTANYDNKFWTLKVILATFVLSSIYGIGLLIPAWYFFSKYVLKKHYGKVYVISVTSAGTSSEAYHTASLKEAQEIVQAVNNAIAGSY